MFKVGQKVVARWIPARDPKDFANNQFPIMEIVGLSKDRILLEVPDFMFVHPSMYGWYLYELPQKYLKEYHIIQAQKCDTKVLYTRVDYAEPHPESGPGLPQATLKLEQQVMSLDGGASCRIIASNAHNETYLLEDPNGQKVTLDLLKQMDICIGQVIPHPNWDSLSESDKKSRPLYHCRCVKMQDGLLLNEETSQQYKVVE